MAKSDTKYVEDGIITSEIKAQRSSWEIEYCESNTFFSLC